MEQSLSADEQLLAGDAYELGGQGVPVDEGVLGAVLEPLGVSLGVGLFEGVPPV